MGDRNVFISTLSRRELARRRPWNSRRPVVTPALVIALSGLAAYLLGRGGL